MIRSILFVFILIAPSQLPGQEPATSVDYNRDVRPILSDNCYACHGPDENQRSTILRLDLRESAVGDLGGYRAIVPGKPEQSELIRRIYADELEIMPPSDHRKSLSDDQKSILKNWVAQGASFDEHWSFRPLTGNRFPGKQRSGAESYIDHFVQTDLLKRGIKPSQAADEHTLVRRLYFDLLGLPPTPEEIDRYIESKKPDRYEQLVDQLLESEHFGEKLAVYWLDLVRYADSVGYHGDQPVSVSPYRDYVINAFNKNMPFDQFTREQLAGDLIPNATLQQKIASGYNRLGMMSAEGGVQPKEYLAKYAADRVRTTASVWLGVTLGCAECHDHKFDPFTTKEFYQFAAFFADIKEKGLYSGAHASGKWGPNINVPEPWLADLLKPIDAKIAELDSLKNKQTPELIADFEQWLKHVSIDAISWEPLPINSVTGNHKTEFTVNTNQVLVTGNSGDKNTYTIEFIPGARSINGIRLNALPHDTLPKNGPGRAGNGNFVVSEIRVWKVARDNKKTVVAIGSASASAEQVYAGDSNPYKKWNALSTIDKNAKGDRWGWAILPEVGKKHALVLQLVEPLELTEQEHLLITIEQNHGGQHTLGHFSVDFTSNALPITATKDQRFPKPIQAILSNGTNQISPSARKELLDFYRNFSPELARIQMEIDRLQASRENVVKANTRTTLVTVSVAPRTMRVLKRGNWMDDSGEVVSPHTPKVLSLPDIDQRNTGNSERLSRMDLANWIVSAKNPLTARVFVNRLWKLCFGHGLAKTVDDFGAQGESPTHPELLDALAIDFQQDWNIKRLIKTIVMSNTYRQSSMPRKDLTVIDPHNRLLARQSRFRIDAEFVRDNALAVSGLLVEQIGGRSVMPYQPAGLYRHLNFPTRKYQADSGDEQYRRGVYTHWQRQYLHPAMKTFDAPSREECTAERPRSNTPLAALVMLNDPSFVEAARVFAETIMQKAGSTDEKKIESMIYRALGRPAVGSEVNILTNLLRSHHDYYKKNANQAKQLVSIGQSTMDESVNPTELAAWTSVARAIFNMHEFITRN